MYTCMCMYRERKRDTRNSGREPKVHHLDGVSETTNKRQEKVMCFIDSKKIIDIFDWDVDVSWRIWLFDLINHSNDHSHSPITFNCLQNFRKTAWEEEMKTSEGRVSTVLRIHNGCSKRLAAAKAGIRVAVSCVTTVLQQRKIQSQSTNILLTQLRLHATPTTDLLILI